VKKKGPGGRPIASRTGEVDARILDAATALFLAHGFDGTTFDHVAELARAGKTSIYARFHDKEALFIAVVRRNVERTFARTAHVSTEVSLRDRLVAVGLSILEQSLVPDVISLMRVVIAEAGRRPAIATHANTIGYEQSVRRVAEVIAARPASEDAIERATQIASKFVELIFLPILMHALMGRDADGLRSEAPRRVSEAIDLLEASNVLSGWS